MTGKVFNKVDNMRAILIALLMTIASQAGYRVIIKLKYLRNLNTGLAVIQQ